MVVQLRDYAEAVAIAALRLVQIKDDDPWARQRRPEQQAPPGDWQTWLVMAGRGFGKTRTGAEWVREQVMSGRARRVALTAPTAADTRDIMVEGESGLLAVCGRYGFRPHYEPSKRKLTFPNGAIAKTYSADEPDRLRGPQHDAAWSDEVAAWRFADAWDNLQFGLRLGQKPQQVATTTPKPVKIVRDLLADRKTGQNPEGTVVVTGGSTYDNAANLAPSFLNRIVRRYEGTRLGRQELKGELLEDFEGALWSRAVIEASRVGTVPRFLRRIGLGVDPNASDGDEGSETGIVVAALGADGDAYVLEDRSLHGSPARWAGAVVSGYDFWDADRVVAEINNGGAMVEHTLRTVRPTLPITVVYASRGKLTRAEPVAALYEQGRVHHVGDFPLLEDQMVTYDGTGDSPDRMDALVWILTDLMIGHAGSETVSGNYLDATEDEEGDEGWR